MVPIWMGHNDMINLIGVAIVSPNVGSKIRTGRLKSSVNYVNTSRTVNFVPYGNCVTTLCCFNL